MAAFDGQAAGLPEPPSYDRYQEILDRVLARDSTMAAAHYWKARLLLEETMRAAETAAAELGLVPDSAAVGTVAARVLQHAGAAVASDADDVAYREFYAALLVDDGRPEVAADVLSHPSTAGSLLHLLVQDLVTFAPPSGAEPDAALQAFHYMTGMMGAANSEDPWLSAYLEARLQSWSTNASLADVEAHYRARWPDVRFFPVESWDGAVTAVIVPSPNGWHAVSDSSEFESGAEEEGDFVSLLLLPPPVVAEMAENARNQGVPDGIQRSGPRVGILYANWRRGPAGDEPAVRPAVVPPAPQ